LSRWIVLPVFGKPLPVGNLRSNILVVPKTGTADVYRSPGLRSNYRPIRRRFEGCGRDKGQERLTSSSNAETATYDRLCHRRHLRCDRCYRGPVTADRVGGGSWNRPAAVHGAGPAVAATARTGSGGDPGRGGAAILAAGGSRDCCSRNSSAEVTTALEFGAGIRRQMMCPCCDGPAGSPCRR